MNIIIIVVFVCINIIKGLGLSADIEVTKRYDEDVVSKSFNIRCVPHQRRGDCGNTVLSIQLWRDNVKMIASIQNNGIAYGGLLRSSVQAEGYIDKNMSQTFLSVTIKNAVKEDSGMYSCRFLYLNEFMQMKQEESSTNITITEQDMNDIVKHLISKISFLEELSKYQQDQMSTLKTYIVPQDEDLDSVGNHLLGRIVDLEKNTKQQSDVNSRYEDTISRLETQLKDQGTRLTEQRAKLLDQEEVTKDLNSSLAVCMNHVETQASRLDGYIQERCENDSYVAAFSYGYDHKDTFVQGGVLVFSQKIMEIGGGYDPKTGVFTCQRDGIYAFHLLVTTNGAAYNLHIDLQVNGSTKSTLYAHDVDTHDQSSASTIVPLTAGDRVGLFLKYVSRGNIIYSNDHLSVYSGVLLKLM